MNTFAFTDGDDELGYCGNGKCIVVEGGGRTLFGGVDVDNHIVAKRPRRLLRDWRRRVNRQQDNRVYGRARVAVVCT